VTMGTEATSTLAILVKPADGPGVLEISRLFVPFLGRRGGLGAVSGGSYACFGDG
jgi:hypothetical protein